MSKKDAKTESKSDDDLMCKDCSLVFTSVITAQQHFKGKKHLTIIAGKVAAEKTPTPTNKTHFCNVCNIALNSDVQIKQHYNGIRHKVNAGIVPGAPVWWVEQQNELNENNTKRSSGKGIGETFRCEICALDLNSEFQYSGHISGAKHKLKELEKEEGKKRKRAGSTRGGTQIGRGLISRGPGRGFGMQRGRGGPWMPMPFDRFMYGPPPPPFRGSFGPVGPRGTRGIIRHRPYPFVGRGHWGRGRGNNRWPSLNDADFTWD